MVVPCAADRNNDAVLELTTQFAATFAFEPTIVNVLTPVPVTTSVGGVMGVPETATETAFVGHLAHRLEHAIAATTNFEVLHSMHPGEAIAEHANEHRASLVVMTTRATMGLRRIAVGSVTAEVLRHVHCPVLTIRSDA
jgi:nucleotide-binding universal stress UspA family protein